MLNFIITTAQEAHHLHHLYGYPIAHVIRQWWVIYVGRSI